MVELLDLPFPLLSAPKRDLARCYGLWNAKESVAVPAIVVVERKGIVRYLYVGNDFADRPGEDEVFGALLESPDASEKDATGTAEIHISAEESATSSVHPDRSPITLEQLAPYYRGVFYTTGTLKK